MSRNARIIGLSLWTILGGAYALSNPGVLAAMGPECQPYVLEECFGQVKTTEFILGICNAGNECGYNSAPGWAESCGIRYSCAYAN
jgi:hypothetical protein